MEYLRCVRCSGKLELEALKQKQEINEGFLFCANCEVYYPIISKVPIMWDDFSAYLSNRTILGGQLLVKSSNSKMKGFIKKSLSKVKKNIEDRSLLEDRWAKIYKNNAKSTFYSVIKKSLKSIPKSKLVLEHGCSIGLISDFLAQRHDLVFGIDSSYHGILAAKKTKRKNLDFFVADSIFHPFGKQKFGLVVALNLLEIVEPSKLLKIISNQISNGAVLLTDPYDFERGKRSVKNPLYAKEIRQKLQDLGFNVTSKTRKPSFIPWNLKINERATLNYKVDLVIGKKREK